MDTPVWERVLVYWVNCLKLSKPIQTLENLKDGLFFSNLQKVVNKSSVVVSDVLTSLLNILKEHYPKILVTNNLTTHLSDITLPDLLTITSLLMHYTCIHDRRDVLTSPLCHSLPQTTQIIIKNFLEKIQECSELTNEALSQIICTCVKDTEERSPDQSQHWLSLPNYLDMRQSPLQEILKTPAPKSTKLLEKYKEITKLKTDLEIISEEKENLEEDLRVQINKNKRLEQQLSQKTLEISRLRSEVLALEERTPPHYQDKDFRETQKILRVKVESLEQIIEQCDKENDELRAQRDAERAQIKILETQCQTWLEKYIETDNKLQSLTEHSKEQEIKVENLNVHCSELESLLEELKPKSLNESLTEDSFRSTNTNRRSQNFEVVSSYEDLAHSVIDIQLKDQQKENEELKILLKKAKEIEYNLTAHIEELLDKSNVLAKEKCDLKSMIKEQEEKNKKFESENKKLVQSLSELKVEYEKLQITLCETQQELSKLQNSVNKLASAKRKSDENFQGSCKKISELNTNIEVISTQLIATMREKYLIAEENCVLRNNLKISLDECQELKLSLTNLQNSLDILEHEIHNSIIERELIFKEKQEYEHLLKERTEQLNKSITEYDNLLQINKLLTEQTQNVCHEKSIMDGKLEKSLDDIHNLTRDCQLLKVELENANAQNRVMLEEKNNLVEKYKNLTIDYQSLTTEVEEVYTKNKLILEQNNNFQIDIKTLTNTCHALETELKCAKIENKIILEKKTHLEHEIKNITNNYGLLKTEFDNIVAENKLLLEEKNDLTEKFQNLTKDYQLVTVELMESNTKNKIVLDQRNHFEKEFKDVANNYYKLESDLKNISTENKLLLEDKNHLDQELKNITSNYQLLSTKLETVNIDYKKMLEENRYFVKELENLNTFCQSLKAECEKVKGEHILLIEKKNNLEKELEKLINDRQLLQSKVENSSLILEEKDNILKKMTNDNQLLTNEIQNVHTENRLVLEENGKLKRELKNLMNNYQLLTTESEKLNTEYRLTLEEKNSLHKNLKNSLQIHGELTEKIAVLQRCCDDLKSKNLQIEEDSGMINKKISVIWEELETLWKILDVDKYNCEPRISQISNSLDISGDSMTLKDNHLTSTHINMLSQESSFDINNEKMLLLTIKTIQNLQLLSEKTMKKYHSLSIDSQKLSEEKQKLFENNSDLELLLNIISEDKMQLEHKISESTAEKNLLISEKSVLSEELNNVTESFKKITDELLATKNQIDQLESQSQKIVTENTKLQTDFNRAVTDKNEINGILEVMTNESTQIRDKNKQLSEELMNACAEKTMLIEKLEDIVNARDVLSHDFVQLQNQHKKLSENYEKLLSDNTYYIQKVSNMSEDLNKVLLNKLILINKLSSNYNFVLLKCKQLQTEIIKKEELSQKYIIKCQEVEIMKLKNNKIFDFINKILEFLNLIQKDCMNDDVIEKLSEIMPEHINTQNKQEILQWNQLSAVIVELKTLVRNRKYLMQRNKELVFNVNETLKEKILIEAQFQSLQEMHNELENNLRNNDAEKTIIKNQFSLLLIEKENIVKEVDLAKNDLVQLTEKNKCLEEQISKISMEKLKMNELVNGINETINKVNNVCFLLEQKLLYFSQKLQKLSDNSKYLLEEFSKLLQEKENLLEKINTINMQLETVIKDKDEQEELLNKTIKELNKIGEEKDVLHSSLDLSNKKLQNAIKEKENIFLEKERLLKNLQAASFQMEQIMVENKKTEEMLNEKISITNSEKDVVIKSLNLKNQKIQETLEEKENICKHLETIISKQKHQEKELNEKIEKLIEEKNVISNFLDLNNSELQKVLEENEKLLEALEMSNKEVHHLTQNKDDLLQQIKIITKSLDTTKFEVDNLNKEKQGLVNEILDLQHKLAETTNEQIGISEKFEMLCQEKVELFEQLDKVCQEKSEISKELQVVLDQSCNVADLIKKVDEFSEENARLLVQITSLQNDLEAKSKEVELLKLSNKHLLKVSEEKSQTLNTVSQENQDVFEIVDRISQEKSEMSLSLELTLKELEKRSDEKNQLMQALEAASQDLDKLYKENNILMNSVETKNKELETMKRERNELLESQTNIMKETERSILLAHESAVELKKDLLKRIELVESEKTRIKKQYEDDLKKIREAYANVVSINSKFELENVNLKKKIDERNAKISESEQIKEAYEKLLEGNNQLMTEVDTIKYKRSRDREEMLNILKKEREEAYARETKKIREVRNEYEGKLEKMKEKMLKLYRDEVNKEMQKVKAGQDESSFLQNTIQELRSQLFETEQKLHMLEMERNMVQIDAQVQKQISRESLLSLRDKDHTTSTRNSIVSVRSVGNENEIRNKPHVQVIRKDQSISSGNLPLELRMRNDRQRPTMSRGCVAEIEESVTISRRTSINGVPTNIGNLEMEDEDDDFNNKYLADLKSGKCIVNNAGRESNVNRFSELAWRNSLVPPHLKSSYPAEMQFVSPTHFKEDDIKTGNIELDDSLCKLLPGEKPRQKKDFGTTSYKKPGPPTPSKNGGRLSLQGNEIRPLSEYNERTPKKATPSRIKALFMGKTSLKENIEAQSITPRTNRRLNIFRKQK